MRGSQVFSNPITVKVVPRSVAVHFSIAKSIVLDAWKCQNILNNLIVYKFDNCYFKCTKKQKMPQIQHFYKDHWLNNYVST